MTRQILKGTTYLVTRRCSERRFFLRPSRKTGAIFLYVLAVAADRYGIPLHAFCVLSNHFHLVVTDPHARLPDFHRYLDGLVAVPLVSYQVLLAPRPVTRLGWLPTAFHCPLDSFQGACLAWAVSLRAHVFGPKDARPTQRSTLPIEELLRAPERT